MRRLRLTLALAVMLAVSACAGFSGGSDSSGADDPTPTRTGKTREQPPEPEPPPAPKTGECRDLDAGDIGRFSNGAAPQACGKPHTAYTYEVGELPESVAFAGVDIGNDAVQEAAAGACQAAYADFVGGDTATRALARLTPTYFLPRQRGFDAGAHWVRCDVVALATDDSLAPLPAKLAGFLDRDDALDDYGVCSDGDPSSSGSALVMCSEPHTYRALDALRLGGPQTDYPGTATARDDGQQACEDLVKESLGVDGGFTYAWTYPSAQDWNNGQRFGYCWSKSRS